MKILLDQGVPRSAAAVLRGLGMDAIHTGEIGMSAAEDASILERAASEDRLVVTLDADFHQHLALTKAARPSVVRIRIEGLKAAAFVDLLLEVLASCPDELERGAAVSVREDGIRVRRLPLRV